MTTLSARLAHLYRGQTDVWGHVHGEQIKRPLTAADWDGHVYGYGSVGVYPLVSVNGVWSVAWCGIDIDDGYDTSLVIARNLHKACNALGLNAWVERSKGKGFHLLCFASDWFPALHARAAMLLACHLIEYRPKEIYPKQVALTEGMSGNYLNAAYAKAWADEGRRVVVNTVGFPLQLADFLDRAEASLNSPAKLAEVASWLKPEPTRAQRRPSAPGETLDEITPKLSGLTYRVWRDGPLPHPTTGQTDRSGTLQKLAHLCAADGLAESDAMLLVDHADLAWGKYEGRTDRDILLQRIIDAAYH